MKQNSRLGYMLIMLAAIKKSEMIEISKSL